MVCRDGLRVAYMDFDHSRWIGGSRDGQRLQIGLGYTRTNADKVCIRRVYTCTAVFISVGHFNHSRIQAGFEWAFWSPMPMFFPT